MERKADKAAPGIVRFLALLQGALEYVERWIPDRRLTRTGRMKNLAVPEACTLSGSISSNSGISSKNNSSNSNLSSSNGVNKSSNFLFSNQMCI